MKKKIEIPPIHAIQDPTFLKDLTLPQLREFSQVVREEILQNVANNGGHLSSNLGVVELTIALHRNFDFSKDKLLLDVGHQCYTHKILTGRSLESLRKEDGISGFQKRKESAYDSFEAGHSSTSLSAAYGFAVTRDFQKKDYEVVAVIGDASIANGLAFEGLNNIGHSKHKVILVLNDNDMSISRPTGGFSHYLQRVRISSGYQSIKEKYHHVMAKTRFGNFLYRASARCKNAIKRFFLPSNLFDDLGFAYLGPVDGYDFKALDRAFAKAKKSRSSVCIHVITKKGKGYEPAEKDKLGTYHGVGPFDIEKGATPSFGNWSDLVSHEIFVNMEKNNQLFLINPAMTTGSKLNDIFARYPTRCFDVGICEEHAVSMASGIALNGYHPVLSIYSTFLQRSFDELQQDIARMDLPLTLLIDHAGLVGKDGETHQGIFDEAFLYSIPSTIIAMAKDEEELKDLMETSFQTNHIFAIRYPLGKRLEVSSSPHHYGIGEWVPLHQCRASSCVLTMGPISAEIQQIWKKKWKMDHIHVLYQKPILDGWIQKLLRYKRIYVYQPYATADGFIHELEDRLMKAGYQGKLSYYAIPRRFIAQGSVEEQWNRLHLSPEQVLEQILKEETHD